VSRGGRRTSSTTGSSAEPLLLDDLLYLVVVSVTFDPDDYELRWPPRLFVDEAYRLTGHRGTQVEVWFDRPEKWAPEMVWLLTEAFVSTGPAEALQRFLRAGGGWGAPDWDGLVKWVSQLVQEATRWPEPSVRKPYWSVRTAVGQGPGRLGFDDVARQFVRLIEELETDGYFVLAFGEECGVDDHNPRPNPSAVLESRLGYEDIFGWPLQLARAGWEFDNFCDLAEVLHDLVARPGSRLDHHYSTCGWHYGNFAARPARRLYRWRVNRLLGSSKLGLRLAEEGEDQGRLVRVEPTGLDDLPEKALQVATQETVDRVQHAIALFRSRTAGVEERRSAVITLAGILEERRDLLKAELLSKDETALFQIANQFAVRHQGDRQRGDYDPVFLDWLFWWYLDTVQLTDQLLARQAPGSA
jgi:hypothetical protein